MTSLVLRIQEIAQILLPTMSVLWWLWFTSILIPISRLSIKPFTTPSMAIGLGSPTLHWNLSTLQEFLMLFQPCVLTYVSYLFLWARCLKNWWISRNVILDVDNNNFSGFDSIRKAIVKDDTANIQYSQDLSLIVREPAALSTRGGAGYLTILSQGLCGGWPYTAKSNKKLPINASMLLVTADFDLKWDRTVDFSSTYSPSSKSSTPTESSTVEWVQATNSTLVVRHGDDHGTISGMCCYR